MKSSTSSAAIATGCCLIATAAVYTVYYRRRVDTSENALLQQCHELRLRLEKPRQSYFRVVCCLVMVDGTTTYTIFGTNDEPSPWIGGALCAERAAFLQFALYHKKGAKITRVIITTDADVPIMPGLLCREYMLGSDAVSATETQIIVQSANPESRVTYTTLADLYPYPCIYLHSSCDDCVRIGKTLEAKVDLTLAANKIPNVSFDEMTRLCRAAQDQANSYESDYIHPMRYGAAALIKDDDGNNDTATILSARQLPALEYGGTLDAVGQLVALLPTSSTTATIVIVMTDQFGVPHAPFATGRSALAGNEYCICSSYSNSYDLVIDAVIASTLAPSKPKFR